MASDDESVDCPLCLEELDATDRGFQPCKCGYQVCLWCWHNINEKLNGKCPACRQPYDPEGFQFTKPDPEALVKAMSKKAKSKGEKEKERKSSSAGDSAARNGTANDDNFERNLQGVRVLQRNLLYVVGLPPSIAREETLRKKEYFGKFGRIIKAAVNRRQMNSDSRASHSAYITFKRARDAQKAIEAFNGQIIDGRVIRATYGTTKYCSYFLRKAPCNNPGCLYLHELAKTEDCFTKEDLSTDRFGPALQDEKQQPVYSPASFPPPSFNAQGGASPKPQDNSPPFDDQGPDSKAEGAEDDANFDGQDYEQSQSQGGYDEYENAEPDTPIQQQPSPLAQPFPAPAPKEMRPAGFNGNLRGSRQRARRSKFSFAVEMGEFDADALEAALLRHHNGNHGEAVTPLYLEDPRWDFSTFVHDLQALHPDVPPMPTLQSKDARVWSSLDLREDDDMVFVPGQAAEQTAVHDWGNENDSLMYSQQFRNGPPPHRQSNFQAPELQRRPTPTSTSPIPPHPTPNSQLQSPPVPPGGTGRNTAPRFQGFS